MSAAWSSAAKSLEHSVLPHAQCGKTSDVSSLNLRPRVAPGPGSLLSGILVPIPEKGWTRFMRRRKGWVGKKRRQERTKKR